MNLKRLFGIKTKPTINSIKFSTEGWKLERQNKYEKFWLSKEKASFIIMNFYDGPPTDIPAKLNQVEKIRNHYRQMTVDEIGGGFIKCDVSKIKNFDAIEFIVKYPMKPRGIGYNGSIMLPFKNYNFLIAMKAVEVGITGMREAFTMDKWMSEHGMPKTDENGRMIGFAKDPYDENFTEGRLMNYSEKEEFDKDFPNHPLTIIRTKMKEIKESITFTDELSKLEKF